MFLITPVGHIYVENVSKIAYFRKLVKNNSSKTPPPQWIYKSVNADLKFLSTNQVVQNLYKPIELNHYLVSCIIAPDKAFFPIIDMDIFFLYFSMKI